MVDFSTLLEVVFWLKFRALFASLASFSGRVYPQWIDVGVCRRVYIYIYILIYRYVTTTKIRASLITCNFEHLVT